MPRVRELVGNVRLYLIGDGPRRAQLERLAQECACDTYTEFYGTRSREEVFQLLGRADVFVLSTHYEGLPVAMLEALAAGVPVIASDIPPCREVLADGKAGILVQPACVAEMAAAILDVISLPERRRDLSEAGRRRIEEAYTLKRMIQDYESLFTTMLEGRWKWLSRGRSAI